MSKALTKGQRIRLESQRKLNQRNAEADLNRLMIAQTQLLRNQAITQVDKTKIKTLVREHVEALLNQVKMEEVLVAEHLHNNKDK